LPNAVYVAIDAALAKEPAARPTSAGTLARLLEGQRATGGETQDLVPVPPPARSRTKWWLVAGGATTLLAVAALGAGLVIMRRDDNDSQVSAGSPTPVLAVLASSPAGTPAQTAVVTPSATSAPSPTPRVTATPTPTLLRVGER